MFVCSKNDLILRNNVGVRVFVLFHSLCTCERSMISPSRIVKLQYWPLPDFFISLCLLIFMSLSFLLFLCDSSFILSVPRSHLEPFLISSILFTFLTFPSSASLSAVLHLSCPSIIFPSSLRLLSTNIETDVFLFRGLYQPGL